MRGLEDPGNPIFAPRAPADRHARCSRPRGATAFALRALATGHAKCSQPRDPLSSRPERSRTDTRGAHGPGSHCHCAKSACGQAREMLTAPGATVFAPRALADGHARCSRPREPLPLRQERSRADARDAHGPRNPCHCAKSARGRTREMLTAPGATAFAPGALADRHARCSRPREPLPPRQSARGWTREMLTAPGATAFAPGALADRHARCSRPREPPPPRQSARGWTREMLTAPGITAFAPERSRTDTRDAQGPWIHTASAWPPPASPRRYHPQRPLPCEAPRQPPPALLRGFQVAKQRAPRTTSSFVLWAHGTSGIVAPMALRHGTHGTQVPMAPIARTARSSSAGRQLRLSTPSSGKANFIVSLFGSKYAFFSGYFTTTLPVQD